MPTSFSKESKISHTQLKKNIDHTRKQMILSALTTGFTSPETVQISQQLDNYLNLEFRKRK